MAMNDTDCLTADEFELRLQDGDRWIELVEGRLVRLHPPDDLHGNIVRNLSQRIAKFVRLMNRREHYCCFEQGLRLKYSPDTVRCPAMSFFRPEGNWFSAMDRLVTTQIPALVVEVASSNDRREAMSDRVHDYLEWGVPGVWVVDPVTRHAHVFQKDARSRMFKEIETLPGEPIFPEFRVLVSELFAEPEWA